jgi:heat shock protein HslJ
LFASLEFSHRSKFAATKFSRSTNIMKKIFLGLVTIFIFTFSIQAQGFVGKWKLTSMTVGEKGISIVAPITLNLKDNRIGGKGGCNSYGGNYSLGKSGKVKFSTIISTKMYCEGVSDIESIYFGSLLKANKIQIKNGKLIIQNEAQNIVLVFAKTK